ncbi:carbohydrate-binding protein [Flavicella marina]|uniref:carbohydrate-binding protein n=1 Tax=Flavicella marina TaxID=1475951 RepID=UPI001264CD96|nr:carbohydrate-binding protein [Flavicella marina]
MNKQQPIKKLLFFMIMGLLPLSVFSQTVTIDQSVQRFLGSTSELDRTKYFTIHSSTTSDPEMNNFYSTYNVSRGRGFWGPYSYANNQTGTVGNYPAYKTGGTEVRNVSRFISTEHPKSVIRYDLDKVAAANWAVEYWKDFVNDAGRPEFFEPMNEPFVHSDDAEFAAQQPDGNLMRIRMAEWFSEIGKKMHQAPELANMKIIGYASAWPSMELWDFGHWNNRMKMFIDKAGANMDAFSVHLYDGINVTGQDNFRSGSNSEAILDLIEAYSYIKLGTVKDHAITEYGGIASGYGSTYSDTESAQTVKSFNNILFNLLEREDKMAISIPFATDKSTWHLTAANNYQPYGAVLLRPTNLGGATPSGWTYTPKIYFYDLWKEFKGKRVAVNSDNPDIQAQAFVDGKKMYVALNNLDTSNKTIQLNFDDAFSGFQNVRVKKLKVYDSQNPVFTNTLETSAPSSMTLIGGETVTLEYTFSNNIAFDNAIRSKKYYTSKYLQAITNGNQMDFSFNGVETGTGKATLRMSIGRKHEMSKSPVVKVNGTVVAVPNNWKGYDQSTRSDFFGTIEIPVPMNLIQANNTVSVTFSDNGGHVSSLILQVEKYDTAVITDQTAYPNGVPHAVPGSILLKNYDNGGEGVAYHDTTNGNSGGLYRTNEKVDLGSGDGDTVVGWTVAGEWQEYTVNVATEGQYLLDLRYSAPNNGGNVNISFDGINKTGSMALPATGNWTTYSNVTKSVSLVAGEQVLRVNTEAAGINLANINLTLQAAAVNTINLTAPTTIAPASTYTVSVAYEASQSRDVVVELWNSGWLGQATVTVPQGTGVTDVTINLATPTIIGSGYSWKSSIRPVGGDWTTSLATDNSITGVSVAAIPSVDTIDLEAPFAINPSNTYTIAVTYQASQSRDLVVEFWDSGWLGQATKTVPAGSGTTNISVPLSNVPAVGTDYRWKSSIRPVGGDWTTAIASDNSMTNVAVIEGNTDAVLCGNMPSVIGSSTSYTVDLPYSATQTRDVVVELWNSGWLGYGSTTVNSGTGVATINVNVTNAPVVANNYLWKASIRPVGTNWTSNIDACTQNGVSVNSSAKNVGKQLISEETSAILNETKVFPNPFTDVIHVSLEQEHLFEKVSLIDIHGRVRLTASIAGKTNLEIHTQEYSLVSGIYYLKLTGNENQKIIKITSK